MIISIKIIVIYTINDNSNSHKIQESLLLDVYSNTYNNRINTESPK